MQKFPRYEVETQYGWFSLDEGAYQNYLAGKLWISWSPQKQQTQAVVAGQAPPNVSEEALQLRERAERMGIIRVLRQMHSYGAVVPYSRRLAELSVDELNLTVRASNGLKRANIMTFEDLKDLLETEKGVLSVRNLGQKSAEEIKRLFYEECYARLLPYEKAQYWQCVLDGQ